MLFLPETETNTFSIAKRIFIAHNAIEIGISAIAEQIEALPKKRERYLMDYFDPIRAKKHNNRDVSGKEYCRQLNIVRGNLKHGMILPNSTQWMSVINKTYDYLDVWCQEYLKISLNDLDNSVLINDPDIKELYENAKKELSSGNYRQVLELLAKATYLLFEKNSALRSLQVGTARAEDAIKLAAFGVHANDFLALQDFLPEVFRTSNENILIRWKQESFGHPGNWREDTASFCLKAFLDLVLKIQNAGWIPGPINFLSIYEHEIEAIKDGVEIWSENWKGGLSGNLERQVVKVMEKGERIRGMVTREKKSSLNLLGLHQESDKEPEKISIISRKLFSEFSILYVFLQDVKITCVARESDFVKEYFPNLQNIDMQLD